MSPSACRTTARSLFQLAPATPARRIADVLGDDFVADARHLDAVAGPLALAGLAIDPTRAARSEAMPSICFVNGRFVRDKVIGHALREAYRDVLHGSR